jgi:hypothetical protein
MAKQSINIGSVPNDGTGSTLRDAGDLINDNFNEIYTAIGDGTTLTSGTFLTTSNSETVINKTINGPDNTITNIANSSLSNSTLSIIGDDSSAQSISLGGSILFTGGSGITTSISGNEITFATDGSIVTETSSDILTNKTINDNANTLTINSANSTITIDGTEATLSNIANSSLDTIQNSKLANSTVSIVADDSSAQSISLGGSILFTGGSGITTAISGNEITFSTDGSIVTETSSDVLTNKTINGPDNTITNIANGSLANSSITLGSDTINLGDTTTTITGLSLDGTGTIDLTGAGSKARFNFAGFGLLPTAATYEGMFAYDTVGQVPYVADSGGWTRLQTENDSISVHSDVNLTGIADGYILQWSSAQARFNVVADTGGVSDIVDDTTPQLGGQLDVNGNAIGDGTLELLKFSETASAVNELTITNAATGNGPQLSATGDDTNIDLKLTSKGTGDIVATGSIVPGANDTYDLGASGNVWANIYTGDLNLSNEAKEQGNDVDGTKGNWTIQEGAEDLFLINNNSGKKYKFTLEEI